MWNPKSNRIALVLVWAACFAFVAHTFDLGHLHCACPHFHVRADFSANETGLTDGDFVASSTEVGHFCESDCELVYDTPDIVKFVFLSLSFFFLWKVNFSTVRRLSVSFNVFLVPLSLTVYLFFQSLLI